VDDQAAQDEVTVAELSDRYEAALMANDVDAVNGYFWRDDRVLRFGIADAQRGYDELVEWRTTAAPVSPSRVILSRDVTALAPGVVAVDIQFRDGDAPFTGRQTQTWVRLADGWRIARAHVSIIAR